VARGATARLYDVDHDRLKFVKLRLTKKYDQGTISFHARKGSLVSLDKLHESIWATRLSGGTNSGVICLDVTAVGDLVESDNQIVLSINGTQRQFVLVGDVKAKPIDARESVMVELRKALSEGQKSMSVRGYVDGWVGRWPAVLRQPPAKRPRLMVTGFTQVEK
jgi:hypothetical protein